MNANLDPIRRPHGLGRPSAVLAAGLVLLLAPSPSSAQAPAKEAPANPRTQADPAARMIVTGRVLDPQGKPVPNASVMAYARSMALGSVYSAERIYPREIGRATSDG